MGILIRGIKNAFRNSLRTFSIILVLGISIGLSVIMLLAYKTVGNKINSVKSSIGNTISISPAGFSGFSQVNNSLTTSQLQPIASLPHVTNLAETLTDRLTTIGSSSPSFGGSSQNSNATTSLTSPVKLNINGNTASGNGGGGRRLFISGGGQLPSNFTPPISIIGTNNPSAASAGATITLKSGKIIDGTADNNNAMISTDLASKNNLQVGSTFTAYGTTLTVTGIYDTGTEAGNNAVIVSLPAEQRLSGQSGDVTSAVATVDSLDNLASTTSAIQSKLGSSNADVTSSLDQANQAVAPLNSVKNVSLYSLIGSLIAGSVIILLTLIMIVRERRREIGIMKAIGSSGLMITTQFVVESLTLTLIGSVVGIVLGAIFSNPVLHALVSNATNTANSSGTAGAVARGGGFGAVRNFAANNFAIGRGSLTNLTSAVDYHVILYGLAAALAIAIIGSAIPASIISRIRPVEAMRNE